VYPDTDVLERHMDEVVALAEADMLEAETELLQLKGSRGEKSAPLH
jgi:hypothetical protein